jgi:hypothetical protein
MTVFRRASAHRKSNITITTYSATRLPRSALLRQRPGRTAREVIIAALVVLALAVMISPYLLQRRVASRRNLCEFRLIALGQAVARFEVAQSQYPGYRAALFAGGKYPPASDADALGVSPPVGWTYSILPYLELPPNQTIADSPSFQQIHDQYGPAGPAEFRGRVPEVFLATLFCPSDPRDTSARNTAIGSFVANAGMPDAPLTEDGPLDWPANGILLDAFTTPLFPVEPLSMDKLNEGDGADNCLLLSENLDSGLWTDHEEARVSFLWVANFVDGQPDPAEELLRINQSAGQGDGSRKYARPSSDHPSGVNVVFASGRTQFLSQDIDYIVYANLMTSDTFQVMLPGTEEPAPPPYRSEPMTGDESAP